MVKEVLYLIAHVVLSHRGVVAAGTFGLWPLFVPGFFLFVDSLARHNGMHVVGDIVAFDHPIDDHAFGDGDHLRHRLVQEADNGPLVAAVGIAVGNEGEQLICKFFFVRKQLENA